MTFELDHILVCAPVGAPAADRLLEAGFLEGTPNHHLGQGTVNRRFFFDNAFLEFIWVEDAEEARSDLVQPTRLWERWNWRATGASPFGICLRRVGQAASEIPFATIDYRPPYIPDDSRIPIASETFSHEPMLFVNSMSICTADLPSDTRQPLLHPNSARKISSAEIEFSESQELSAPYTGLMLDGFIRFRHGPGHLLTVNIDERCNEMDLDLRPDLPVVIRW